MDDRIYQIEQVNTILEHVYLHRCVLGHLPTGGGKTVEFSMIIRQYNLDHDKSTLVLVHRKELMMQADKTIKLITGYDVYLVNSTTKKYYICRVYIGMIESLMSRLHMIDNVGLVIIDECHVANFNKIHRIFHDKLIIGFTATPISSSKKEPLNKYYHSIVCGPQIKELISMGYLAQNATRIPKEHVDSSKFQIDKFKGDYNEQQVNAEYRIPKNVINAVMQYKKFCKGTKTICYNVSIEHSNEVAECFRFFGYDARHLGSDNESERDEILQWFKITKDAILCNVGMLTVGYDEPTVISIILNFSSLSLTKFIQCAGRGGRVINEKFINEYQKYYPYELSLKSWFNIVDLGGNYTRFGDWNNDRDWYRIFAHPAQCNEGIAPVKTCPKCEGLIHASSMVCYLTMPDGTDCLHEFERKKTAAEQDIEEMILVTKGINLDQLIEVGTKKHLYYPFLELGVEVVKSMYERYDTLDEGIKLKYFRIYYDLCVEWYNRTLSGVQGNIKDITNSAWHIRLARNNFMNLTNKYEPKQVYPKNLFELGY